MIKPYVYIAAAVAACVALSTLGYMIYSSGQQDVINDLKDDRITILKDGKRIDEEVFNADDDSLFCMLVECVPE